MSVLSNTPTLSYIYIKDMIITYREQSYIIQNTYTNKPYIYWDYNDPYNLIFSNTTLKELAGRFYIYFNDIHCSTKLQVFRCRKIKIFNKICLNTKSYDKISVY